MYECPFVPNIRIILKIAGVELSTQKNIQNCKIFYEFIWTKLATIAWKQHEEMPQKIVALHLILYTATKRGGESGLREIPWW